MCEFPDSNGNGFGDIWWTDKLIYFSSSIDDITYNLSLVYLQMILWRKSGAFYSSIRGRTISTTSLQESEFEIPQLLGCLLCSFTMPFRLRGIMYYFMQSCATCLDVFIVCVKYI